MTDLADASCTRVLVTGGNGGQLYNELLASCPADFTVCELPEWLDVCDRQAVKDAVGTYRPELIINAAAYTAVDRAESEPAAAEAVNVQGPANLAQAASAVSARLLHVSTDFVFGRGHDRPIEPTSTPAPQNVYGHTKLAGERAVLEALADRALIVRTAWMYSSYGQNFVKTMLRLMGERSELGVVADQIGSPTWARRLAEGLWQAGRTKRHGIMHIAGLGVASWYDLAVAIAEESIALGLLAGADERALNIYPISTAEYPTPAVRPCYSVLDSRNSCCSLALPVRHWREDLRLMLSELI